MDVSPVVRSSFVEEDRKRARKWLTQGAMVEGGKVQALHNDVLQVTLHPPVPCRPRKE